MNILLVDDDRNLSFSLKNGLEQEGFSVIVASTAKEARASLASEAIELVLLDLGLPDDDGINLLKEWKQRSSSLPIVIISARINLEDRVMGLELGANDYLVKPFDFAELVARIRNQIRYKEQVMESLYEVEDLVVDVHLRKAARAGNTIHLTSREFDLLAYLIERNGQVISRKKILEDIWQVDIHVASFDNMIDVCLSRLREKVDKEHEVKLIKTIRGAGYTIEK